MKVKKEDVQEVKVKKEEGQGKQGKRPGTTGTGTTGTGTGETGTTGTGETGTGTVLKSEDKESVWEKIGNPCKVLLNVSARERTDAIRDY